MAGSSTHTRIARTGPAPPPLQLVNWPLAQGGVRAWAMLVGLVGLAALAGRLADRPAMGLVILGALAIAGWRLWIPVRYEFSSKGITQSVLGRQRRIPWVEFSGYEVGRQGVLLLTEADAGPLAACRGLSVRWRDRREELLELLEFFIMTRQEPQMATTRTYQSP